MNRNWGALIEGARRQVVALQAENVTIRELNQHYETAGDVHRDLVLRVQQALLTRAERVVSSALPFQLTQPVSFPLRPEGLQRSHMALIALAGGLVLSVFKLLLTFLGRQYGAQPVSAHRGIGRASSDRSRCMARPWSWLGSTRDLCLGESHVDLGRWGGSCFPDRGCSEVSHG